MDPNQTQGKTADERLDAYFANTKAEEVKQPEAMPTSNVQPTDAASETPATPEIATPKEDDELTLPENASERTRQQFEKLKNRLKEKEEELAKRNSQPVVETPLDDYNGTSVFDMFHPVKQEPVPQKAQTPPIDSQQYEGLNPLQVQSITQQFIDKDGNVDVAGLNTALSQANQRAIQAEQRVMSIEEKMARFEETQQAKEAHTVYPSLDPSNKSAFDKQFFEAVRDRLLRNMYEGKKQTLLEVATDINRIITPKGQPVNATLVQKQAIEEYQKAQQARVQGPLEQGVGETRGNTESYDELRKRTRLESAKSMDSTALDERLSSYFSSVK